MAKPKEVKYVIEIWAKKFGDKSEVWFDSLAERETFIQEDLQRYGKLDPREFSILTKEVGVNVYG